MQKYAILLMGLVLIAGYQNCSNQMGFAQEEFVGAKIEQAMDDGLDADLSTPETSPPGTAPSDETSPGTPVVVVPTPTPGPKDHDGDCDERDGHDHRGHQERQDRLKTDFVCVLQGPGASRVLALLPSGMLGAQNSTPRSICMTERACEDIVRQAFEVKGPEKRGYCINGSADSIAMNDAQIKAAMDRVRANR